MPMPRNDASRMKFEKYDSSRTCAGIQRMSATSRNRTRNDARKTRTGRESTDISAGGSRATPSRFRASSGQPFHSGTITLPMYCRSVDAHLARPEPGRGQIAEAVEEGDAVREFRLRLLRPGDVVEDGGALVRRCTRGTACRSGPGTRGRSSARPPRIGVCRAGLVHHHEIHELRHAGVGGAARPRVLRDDQVDQDAHGRIFVRGEELRLEERGARRRGAAPPAPPAPRSRLRRPSR